MSEKIILGDCEIVMPSMPFRSVNLVITSPPYDELRNYEGITFDFEKFKKVASELYRIIKDGGVLVWIVGDQTKDGSESMTSFKQALYFREIGFKLHDTMIYEKSGFSNPSNNRYHQIFEYMFIFVKGKLKTFNPIKDYRTKYLSGGTQRRKKDGTMSEKKERIKYSKLAKRRNIWRYATGMGNSTKDEEAYEHPAVFPDKLARDHILSWSNEGDLILDCFAGSGTVLKMAQILNRDYIGIEISKKYYNIIKKRLSQTRINLK